MGAEIDRTIAICSFQIRKSTLTRRHLLFLCLYEAELSLVRISFGLQLLPFFGFLSELFL